MDGRCPVGAGTMERESEGDEGDAREENRRRRKEGSFGVE